MPHIRKTKQMLIIERRFAGKDIRDILIEALRGNARDQDAAGAVGILPTTMSHWIARLSLTNEAEEARQKRLDNTTAA